VFYGYNCVVLFLSFVGWLTNFIHNRNAVHVNMLRGWSTSTFSNAVSRDVVRAIADRLRGRGEKPAVRGFLLDAEERFDKRRRLTVKGSGDIAYKSNTRNSRMIRTTDVVGLRPAIMAHAAVVHQLAPHQVPGTLKKLTAGVRINGRPWKTGDLCFYFLTTDNQINALPRIGQVEFFVVDKIGRHDHLFVILDQRPVVDRRGSIIIYDITQPVSRKILHVEHLTHLVASLPYWHAGRPDIRCGVPICTTV
jgi:hypothetical protein